MKDKRYFYNLIGCLQENFPDHNGLLESVMGKFDSLFESISKTELKALKRFPVQFIYRVPELDGSGEWTSKLHIWAEQGVKDVLNVDPIILSFKNSSGDTVLMSFIKGSLGSLLNKPNYENIRFALSKDYNYTNPIKNEDGTDGSEEMNVMDITDIENYTPLDHIIDVAYAQNDYVGESEDPELQQILEEYLRKEEKEDIKD